MLEWENGHETTCRDTPSSFRRMKPAVCLAWACALASVLGAASDHFDGAKFFNPTGVHKLSPLDIAKLLWKMPEYRPVPVTPSVPPAEVASGVRATWVGHSTFLVQTREMNFLTDPIWSERASPFSWIGPKRCAAPGVRFEDLPRIDAVFVSHNHYDHMDEATLKRLNEKWTPVFFVPLGNGVLLRGWGIKNIVEMDWWGEKEFRGTKIVCVPAQHFSRRLPFGEDKALWSGWMVEAKAGKFYFAGDTGYFSGFKEIRRRLGAPDWAALPIGAYFPPEMFQALHLNPEQAVRAMEDLGAREGIAMHFDTFALTLEPQDEPPARLRKALRDGSVSEDRFWIPRHGESRAFGAAR